ncbi:cytochrome c [Stutzerimonas stutzeri]|nr:cytochrome c [Stutzerimonas stutzeri]
MSMDFERRLSLALASLLLGSASIPALAADLSAAKAKAKMCAACHGIDGLAKVADAPNLAGNGELYLARQLQAFRSGERKHPQMSVIASGLSDEDIAAVTAWYSAIKVSVELPE